MVRNLKVVNTEKNDTENEFSVSLCLQSEMSPFITGDIFDSCNYFILASVRRTARKVL